MHTQVFHPPCLITMSQAEIYQAVDGMFSRGPSLFAKLKITAAELKAELLAVQAIAQNPGDYHGDMAQLLDDCGGEKGVKEAINRSWKDNDKKKPKLTAQAYLSTMWWQRLRVKSPWEQLIGKAGQVAIQVGVLPVASAESEHFFSILKMFDHLRMKSLNDQIEAGCMGRYNMAQKQSVMHIVTC